MMGEDCEDLGKKIKSVREKKQISLEELSKKLNIDEQKLKEIEEGKRKPSLALVSKIAKLLEMRLAFFIDDAPMLGPIVSRNNNSKKLENFSENHNNMLFYSLAYNKQDRHMEPFIIDVLPIGEKEITPSSHEGEEFIYVLYGEIEITYGSEKYILKKGDSIYFDSVIDHTIKSLGNSPARILAVIYTPY